MASFSVKQAKKDTVDADTCFAKIMHKNFASILLLLLNKSRSAFFVTVQPGVEITPKTSAAFHQTIRLF